MSSKMIYAILVVLIVYVDARAKTIEELTCEIFCTTKTETGHPTTSMPPERSTSAISSEEESAESECNCVPYYRCENGSVNTNGAGIIDIR